MEKIWFLGNAKIDQQHHELFLTLQRLSTLDACVIDATLDELLSQLSAQIYQHFISEEQTMREVEFPESLFFEHHLAHTRIIEELTLVHMSAMHGKPPNLSDMIEKVVRWVQIHFVEYDLALRPYFDRHPA